MASTTKIFKNVRIIWKNFSGQTNDFNPPLVDRTTGQPVVDKNGRPLGKRYFSIVLTEEMAEELRGLELRADSGRMLKGCNVKTRLPQNGEGDPLYTLKVGFGAYPPEAIWRIIPKGRMALDLDTVGNLDHEFIDHADVKVTFATYEKGPNSGITAYLSKLKAYVQEDDFDSDESFAGIPIIGGPSVGYSAPPSDEEDLPF